MGIKIFGPEGTGADNIFVYCDLKHKGKLNHILLSTGCRFLKKGVLSGYEMYNILNSYPIIISSRSFHEVQGEIWSIGHAKIFDSLDSIKSPMARKIYEIKSGKEKLMCWMYFMPEMAFNPDASGVRLNKEGKWKV